MYPIIRPRICSHEKNQEVSHSSPPSRFSQASGSPPLLSYGGSCPHRAAYLHRRTQRRTAPVFLSVSRQRVCVRGGHVCGAPRPGAARRPREHCSAQLPACAERRPQGGGWPALICWLVHWVCVAVYVSCTKDQHSMKWCSWLSTWGGALDSARPQTSAPCTSQSGREKEGE